MWTKLGGNYDDLIKYESNLALLSEISAQHLKATNIVRGTLGELQHLQSELTRIRKEVYFTGGADELDYHLDIIRRAARKLMEDQNRAKRLGDEAHHRMYNPTQQARIEPGSSFEFRF